jgi:microcin C transport system permease protein
MLEGNNKSQFLTRFKKNKRGLVSFIVLCALFTISLFAELIANDKPLIVRFDDKFYLPIFKEISEKEFDGELQTGADFRDPVVKELINKKGWMIMPLIEFSYDTINLESNSPAPSHPTSDNLLGTDDQGRDVLSRVIYGVRISLLFALGLSFFSGLIAIFLGAIQGYFAGLIDISLQRFTEIWASLPMMFLLIIFSAIIAPSFFTLLVLMTLFSWISLAGVVRAEFLRLRNFEFVMASRALGASSWRIIFRHILPNASPIIIANLPFLMASSLTTLTALDFLGFGLPVGSASLGEILAQGKNNLQAYWLGITGFVSITIILSSLIFLGEEVRDGFDVRK